MLCSKPHCQKTFNLKKFSCQIGHSQAGAALDEVVSSPESPDQAVLLLLQTLSRSASLAPAGGSYKRASHREHT